MEDNRRYMVPILLSTGEILKFLSRYQHRKSTLSEISQALGISKSTCFRILRTLEEMKYVTYDKDTKRYSLGSYLAVLGSRAMEQIDYLALGRETLREIASQTGLSCVIVQRITENRLAYIAKEDGKAHRLTISVSNQFPITQVSFGKVYLAYETPENRERILAEGLVRLTPNTITDVERYKEELRKVRRVGYATSNEEYIPGIKAVAAPVFDSEGKILMLIGCIGIAAHIPDDKLTEYGELVKRHADALTAKLNGVIPHYEEIR